MRRKKHSVAEEREQSWLYTDVPVYKQGNGKKARWFVVFDDKEIEIRPVNSLVLFNIARAYVGKLPEEPIIELQLEDVAATQRMRDPQNADYVRETNQILHEMDRQMTSEVIKGVVMPEGDDWAADWINEGRPLPAADTRENRTLRTDIYLGLRGVNSNERLLIIRAIQAITEETPEAIERAQALFRYYLGRSEDPEPEVQGVEHSDEPARREDDGDASVADDPGEVVQAADGGPSDNPGPRAKPKRKRVSRQPE